MSHWTRGPLARPRRHSPPATTGSAKHFSVTQLNAFHELTNARSRLRTRVACFGDCVQGNSDFGSCACPVNCTVNGACVSEFGTCNCRPGWGGIDCSVALYDAATVCSGIISPPLPLCFEGIDSRSNKTVASVILCAGGRVSVVKPCETARCDANFAECLPSLNTSDCAGHRFGACQCNTEGEYYCPPDNVCFSKWDGDWCKNISQWVSCAGGKILSRADCAAGYMCKESDVGVATCVPPPPPPPEIFDDPPYSPPPPIDPDAPVFEFDPNPWPSYALCESRWSPNVCEGATQMTVCKNYNSVICDWGCIDDPIDGARCACNCGEKYVFSFPGCGSSIVVRSSAMNCSRLGTCQCSAGWAECPPGWIGPNCTVESICKGIWLRSSCNPATSRISLCVRFKFIWEKTCAAGCNAAGNGCNCFHSKCVNGYCSTDGKCLCRHGWRGEACDEGGECVRNGDGSRCYNSTHLVTCSRLRLIGTLLCPSGQCAEECIGGCCPSTTEVRVPLVDSEAWVALLFGVIFFAFLLTATWCTWLEFVLHRAHPFLPPTDAVVSLRAINLNGETAIELVVHEDVEDDEPNEDGD